MGEARPQCWKPQFGLDRGPGTWGPVGNWKDIAVKEIKFAAQLWGDNGWPEVIELRTKIKMDAVRREAVEVDTAFGSQGQTQ